MSFVWSRGHRLRFHGGLHHFIRRRLTFAARHLASKSASLDSNSNVQSPSALTLSRSFFLMGMALMWMVASGVVIGTNMTFPIGGCLRSNSDRVSVFLCLFVPE
ncbi:hypothetical protein MSAN_00496600 [Mycena sanguinolenta]|uniref:Uncharacterized protein n=1 Tax=Mycena sanguinolenta TaxID=230812 RepID=A0A8H6Z5F2_9AGAR|nr:hypothetical protein MSAN_00496600 [Mycena sanguinolenta]